MHHRAAIRRIELEAREAADVPHEMARVLAKTLEQAGFRDVEVRKVDSPVRLLTAAERVRFECESFGALHQMMAGMSDAERADTWREMEATLARFETPGAGFVGPCEMLVGAGRATGGCQRDTSRRIGAATLCTPNLSTRPSALAALVTLLRDAISQGES